MKFLRLRKVRSGSESYGNNSELSRFLRIKRKLHEEDEKRSQGTFLGFLKTIEINVTKIENKTEISRFPGNGTKIVRFIVV